MRVLVLAALVIFATPTDRSSLTRIEEGSVVPVSGYCREPEPLRIATLEAIKEEATKRPTRFNEVIQEFMVTPSGRDGLPLCARLPYPAEAVALFQVLEPVAVSPTEQIEFWAAWWAESGGKLYINVVAPRKDA